MKTKNINFDDKKKLKNDFYIKKAFQLVGIDVNKILVSKTEQYGAKHLNSLLDIMIMMLLGHYV